MNTIDAALDERIRAFAASVRAHLDDLPAEDAEDITAGLVADLLEKAADNDGVIDLDDPAGYAAELRAAAGLPARGSGRSRVPFGVQWERWRAETSANVRSSRFGAWLLDLFVALRPVWWMLRGAGLYAVLIVVTGSIGNGFWPKTLLGWLILGALTLVSVQWGRDRWVPKGFLLHIRTIASVIAAIALPFTVVWMVTPQSQYVSDEYYAPHGLLLDGVQVGNIFAYDADGNPIEDVQLFTGKGTPLNLYGADEPDYGWLDDSELLTVPLRDFRDQPIWNVYPLQVATLEEETGEPDASTLERAMPPFDRATAVSSDRPTPSSSPGAPEETEPPTDPVQTPAP